MRRNVIHSGENQGISELLQGIPKFGCDNPCIYIKYVIVNLEKPLLDGLPPSFSIGDNSFQNTIHAVVYSILLGEGDAALMNIIPAVQ